MNNKKQAFTFIELIVTAIILVLISAIGFYSFVGYLSETRDGSRRSDMSAITTALKSYKQSRGVFPFPGDKFSITNNALTVAYQGKFNKNVKLSTLDELPRDPHTDTYYLYSTKKNRQEQQIAMTLENGDFPTALVGGDYATVSKNVLPSLFLALESTSSIEIGGSSSWRDYFILDKGDNLPYSLEEPYDPYYAGGNIDETLSGGIIDFDQDASFRYCYEIGEAKKSIGDGTYEVLNGSGFLQNIDCKVCGDLLINNSDTCAVSGSGSCGSANGTTISSEPFGASACSSGNKFNYKISLTKATWECLGAGINEGEDAYCEAIYNP